MRLVEFRLSDENGKMLLETVYLNPEHVAAVEGHAIRADLMNYRHTTVMMRDGTRYEVSNDSGAVSRALMDEDIFECESTAEWGRQHLRSQGSEH